MEKIEVEKIQRLDVRPGETLVVTLPAHTDAETAQRVSGVVRERLPDGVELLVVTNGIELGVVARSEAVA